MMTLRVGRERRRIERETFGVMRVRGHYEIR